MKNVKNISRTLLALCCFLTALLCTGCSDSSNSNSRETKNCVAPENPYDEDTGHYAGFNWAQENGETCDGNSESFNEGCEEYYSQLNSYEACLKKSQ